MVHTVIARRIGRGRDLHRLAELHGTAGGKGQIAGTVGIRGNVDHLIIRVHGGNSGALLHDFIHAGRGDLLHILAGDQLAADPRLLVDGGMLSVHALSGHPLLSLGKIRRRAVHRSVLRLLRDPLVNRQVVGDGQRHTSLH